MADREARCNDFVGADLTRPSMVCFRAQTCSRAVWSKESTLRARYVNKHRKCTIVNGKKVSPLIAQDLSALSGHPRDQNTFVHFDNLQIALYLYGSVMSGAKDRWYP